MRNLLFLLPVMLIFTSCSVVQTPIQGMLFTEVKANVHTSDAKIGRKKGKVCATSIFGVAQGDTSIKNAMKEGGIKKVTHIDHEVMSVLGIYAKHCIVAYGN